MFADEKAAMLLSRAELCLVGAEHELREKRLPEIAGELQAVNTILDVIRQESDSGIYDEDMKAWGYGKG